MYPLLRVLPPINHAVDSKQDPSQSIDRRLTAYSNRKALSL